MTAADGAVLAAPFLLVLLLSVAGAAALTVDLPPGGESGTLAVAVSRGDASRVEFPETVLNAFTSSAGLDVKIFGKSAVVRTSEEAELIVLTEKRRLTLLLEPEDVPSRTVILRAPEEEPPAGTGEADGGEPARSRERAAVALTLSLVGKTPPLEAQAAPRAAVGGRFLVSSFASAEDGDLEAAAAVVENAGRRATALSEEDLAGPATRAVWIEKRFLRPGESARAVIVRSREAGR